MIGVILAAGKGSRLGNLTEDMPKSLLQLNQQDTLLDYNIKVLQRLEVDKIIVVTGFCSEKIENHIKSYVDIEYIYNPFWNYCNVLGSLYMAFPHINDDFLFLHADTIVDFSVWERLIQQSDEIVLPYKEKPCGEEEMKVQIKGNTIEFINKTMNPNKAAGEFLGIAKFSHEASITLFEISETLFKQGNLHLYMEAAIQQLISIGRIVNTFEIGDADFIEVDFQEDYDNARQVFNKII